MDTLAGVLHFQSNIFISRFRSAFLEKRTKYNTPSIESCKCLTLDEVGPLLSLERNKAIFK